MRGLALVLLVTTGCRVGFEPLLDAGAGADRDALGPGDVQVPVGFGDGSVPTSCGAPAPFIYLLAPREEGSASGAVTVYWCSSGLAGPVSAALIEPDRVTMHSGSFPASGPIDVGYMSLVVGGSACSDCFVRLEANGMIYDGPPGEHSGD